MEDTRIKLKSRNNTELIIYNMQAGGEYPIHGAYKSGDEWIPYSWTADGAANVNGIAAHLDIAWDKVSDSIIDEEYPDVA